MLTRAAGLVLVVSLPFALAACGSDKKDTSAKDPADSSSHSTAACVYTPDGTESDAKAPASAPSKTGTVAATINLNVGKVAISLDAAVAPCTVNSFLSLAQQGFFDKTSCHRLTTAGIFVLQCGDPTGTGAGGPGYSFADELDGAAALPDYAAAQNVKIYKAGTIAMANAGANTNGSQFFLVYGDSPLPPAYAVFGTFNAAGIDLIKSVAAKGSDNSNGQGDGKPNEPVTIDGVSIS